MYLNFVVCDIKLAVLTFQIYFEFWIQIDNIMATKTDDEVMIYFSIFRDCYLIISLNYFMNSEKTSYNISHLLTAFKTTTSENNRFIASFYPSSAYWVVIRVCYVIDELFCLSPWHLS